MHPITPALKGWRILAVVVGIVVIQSENLREAVDLRHGKTWLAVLGAIVVIAIVGFAYSSLAWRVTRFAVTDEAVHLRTGLLFRQQRQARLDRLQAVDVVQPLLARLVGPVRAEDRDRRAVTAPASRSRSCARRDAEVLRAELLALAAGLPPSAVGRALGPAPSRTRRRSGSSRPPAAAPHRRSTPPRSARCTSCRCPGSSSRRLRSGAVPVLVLLAAGLVTAAHPDAGTSARSSSCSPPCSVARRSSGTA